MIHSLQSDGALTLAGGTLAITSDSVLNWPIQFERWYAGRFRHGDGDGGDDLHGPERLVGLGRTVATGQMVIDGTSTTKYLNARTLVVAGVGTWRGGNLATGNGAQIIVPVGGSFDIQTDAILMSNLGGVRTRLQNDGVVTMSSGGMKRIDAALDNRGLLQVSTSTLELNGGGVSSGSFVVQNNSVLDFGGQTHELAPGSTVSGVGTVLFSGGTVNIDGTLALSGTLHSSGGTANLNGMTTLTGTLRLSNSGNLNLNDDLTVGRAVVEGGALGGSATVTATEVMTWTGGTLAGTGRTKATGQMVIEGASIKYLNARTLEVAGIGAWRGGNLYTGNGSQILIPAGSSFDIQTDAILLSNLGGVRTRLQNDGAVMNSSGALTRIDAALDNRGLVQVSAGTLKLNGGGISSGAFAVQSGAELEFSGQIHELGIGSTISGLGTVHFSGSTANLGGALALPGLLRVAGATVNINADGTVGRASIESGTLGGSGTITATEVMTWTGGTLGGSGRTVATGQMVIDGTSTYKYLNAHTLVVAGVGTWRGGNLTTGNGARIIVPVGGSFDIQTDALLRTNLGGVRTRLQNDGVVMMSSGGVKQIDAALDNRGLLQVSAGTLELNGGGVSTGTFVVQNNAVLDFGGLTHELAPGSTVSSVGTILFSGGIVNLSGELALPGLLRVAGAAVNINADGTVGRASIESGTLGGSGTITATEVMTWTGGTLGGSGRTVANGQMVIEGASVKTLNARTLVVAGVGAWRAGSLYTGNGARIIVPIGGSFDIQTNATLFYNQGGVRTRLENDGVVMKSSGADYSHRRGIGQSRPRAGLDGHIATQRRRDQQRGFCGPGWRRVGIQWADPRTWRWLDHQRSRHGPL